MLTGVQPRLFYIVTESGGAGGIDLAVPAGFQILSIQWRETAGFAVTGGIKIGTTLGGTEIVTAQAVGANSIGVIKDAVYGKKWLNPATEDTLYIDAVTAWNGAGINIQAILTQMI